MVSSIYTELVEAFPDLVFEEERHLYHIRRNNRHIFLPSVSSKVESHAPKFDEVRILPRCAAKEGITELELKRKWQLINQTACELGIRTHDFLEHYTGVQQPSSPQERAGIEFIRSLRGKYEIEIREFRAYSEKYLFAGTMDLPLVRIGTRKLIIADYKTNGDLFKEYGNLKMPFYYLDNSPYNKYQLQLSYYQILLEEKGYEIEDRWLVHLRVDGTYKIFPTFDFTKELRVNLAEGKLAA